MKKDRAYGNMLQEYYVARVRRVLQERQEARARVRTRAQVLALRDEVRAKLAKCFGPMPKRTPLNAQVTGVTECRDCRVEKVIFESRPGFAVTANLYVPLRSRPPFPVVLGTCGHIETGKISYYQFFAENLARQGYLTLLYDPVSQGERTQFRRAEWLAPWWGCVREHSTIGKQMALVGEFLGAWMVWDGVRALDYLLSRPEADPTRVGLTGQSGGGTQTTYLTAFEERFTMAAPAGFVTSYESNIENELPADSEQNPPGILAAGLDHADFFLAHIPRPTILLGQNNDYFDRRGLEGTYEELRRFYRIMGAEENIQLFMGPSGHGFGVQNREAMYRFFNHHAGIKARTRENPSHKPLPPEALRVTPRGKVIALGGRRTSDFIRERAEQLASKRSPLSAKELSGRIARCLQLPERSGPPHYRILRQRELPKPSETVQSRFAVESEPGIQTRLHIFAPEPYFHLPAARNATLYVPHLSARDEFEKGEAPEAEPLHAVDVRGIGEMQSQTCYNRSDFFRHCDHEDFYSAHALMLNASYPGRRVHDLLSVLDLLENNGCRSIHLVGRGLGSIAATFAACLHPLVKRVTLHNALLSYEELTRQPAHRWPVSIIPWNVLNQFDLPDCYRLLRSKGLAIVEPWDYRMKPFKPGEARQRLASLGIEKPPVP